jgi:3-oxoacyl-[acyl-carrier protein] reductase
MDLGLTDKTAIVTGASRGIGRAIACQLAAEGMRLLVVARTREQLDELAEVCPTECLVQSIDLREAGAAAVVVDAAVTRFGKIDLLVNNAGATKRGDFLTLPDADWNDGFALKFFGAMRLCRAAWPYLQSSRGSIVNISGTGGRTANAEFTIGGAVNAAVLNLTKALADRGLKDGVRVNAINPGLVTTDRLRIRIIDYARRHGIDEIEAARRMAEERGIERFGTPEEIAHLVAFLASPAAAYCQGSIVDADGGETHTL